MLTLFKHCDREFFHQPIMENSWAPEKILRHLLTTLLYINNDVLGQKNKLDSPLKIKASDFPDDKIALETIEKEYLRIAPSIREGIENFTEEKEQELFPVGEKQLPRGQMLLWLLIHEQNHFGQINWILKRRTGWTLADILKITSSNSEE